MRGDFTYDAYARLLEEGAEAGLSFLTVREYLSGADLPDGFVVLRHDVDRKPGNALDFARIEAERGIASTYYVRTGTFDQATAREMEALGHEVGYHYEDLDRADGDVAAARASFAANLERFRRVVDVDTVCMHGNPLTPHDNRDIWGGGVGYDEFDLLGEAYLSMDFSDVLYFSDTGRTWRDGALKVKDHTVGEDRKRVQVDTTGELVALLGSNPDDRFCLLTHPDRWAGGRIEWAAEYAFDLSKNAAKYAMYALPDG